MKPYSEPFSWPRTALIISMLVATFFVNRGTSFAQSGPQDPLPTRSVEIVTQEGTPHRFRAELANTPTRRQIGLMFRESLAADAAMLFDFGYSEPVAMWMKNTLIPLDMLFIREDGTIANIKTGAEPQSETLIRSKGHVRYVLEIAAGQAALRGLKAGDRMTLP